MDKLVDLLTHEPILGHFDTSAYTELRTDACDLELGTILCQRQDNVMRNIAFASRILSKCEKNYTITEKECLAIVWSVEKFRDYLIGRSFTIITDHCSLCWLLTIKDPNARLVRWALKLQPFDFVIKYKSGKLHSDADCISRHPLEQDDEDCGISV